MSEPAKPYIGGQAVIEGVMMRSRGGTSVAVRRPDGVIAVRDRVVNSKMSTSPLFKLPGFRGIATLVESLTIGWDALRFSAEQQMTEEERKSAGAAGKGAVFLSTLIALFMFIALPQLLTTGAGKVFGFSLDVKDPLFHLMTGGFKLVVLATYLFVISRIPEVRRVFQYHGAEHKTIFAYEAGLPITVENVRAQSTLHPRCGTTFLVVVVVVSVILGSIVTPLVVPDVGKVLGNVLTLGVRVALLPLIAAVSYELQRLSARYCTTGPLRVLLLPGFLFQKITTREPDDAQIEIAIAAMQSAIWREHVGVDEKSAEEPLLFPTFAEFATSFPAMRPLPSVAQAA